MLYNLFFKHFLLSCVESSKRGNPKQDTPYSFASKKAFQLFVIQKKSITFAPANTGYWHKFKSLLI